MRNTITVLSIVLFLFTSCDPFTYYNIPKEEKPLLANNDTIYYLNKANNAIDTFRITIYHDYSSSDYSSEEYIHINYLIVNKITTFESCSTMQGPGWATVNLDPYKNSSSTEYFNSSFNNNERNHENPDSIINNMNINGIIYPTVYKLDNPLKTVHIPNTVYYTFKNGIIRYDYADGRKYELMSETVEKK